MILKVFHKIAFYLPIFGISLLIWAHLNLFFAIKEGEEIDIRARAWDFIHWLMLISISFGAYFYEGASIGWCIGIFILITIIAAQIGIGIKRKLEGFSLSETVVGIIFAFLAICLGFIIVYFRRLDESYLGWGWRLEIISVNPPDSGFN